MILDHTIKLTKEDVKIFVRKASHKVKNNDENLITSRYNKDNNDLKAILLSRMNSENTHEYVTPEKVKEWLDDDEQW